MEYANGSQPPVPENYDRYLGPVLFEPYALDIINRLRNKTYSKVLELACGTGRVTNHLLELTGPQGRISAIDIDKGMLEVAKRNISNLQVDWFVGDAQKLSFKDAEFDLVVCQFGIMFFPDKAKAFAEAYRVLKSGGLFLFNVWDELKFNPGSALMQDILKEILLEDAPDFRNSGPFSFNNKDVITQMMEDAGFEMLKMEVIKRTGYYQNSEDLIKGFVDGSLLAYYLQDKDPAIGEKLKNKIRESMHARFGNTSLEIPMQAIVIEAKKPAINPQQS